MQCYDVSNMFLDLEILGLPVKTVWRNINNIFQRETVLKELQLQRSNLMSDKGFHFIPEADIKIVMYRTNINNMCSVLIGCWLFDCRNKYPLYVHSKSEQISNVISARNIQFIRDGPLKLKFENLLKQNDYMRYGL